MWVSECEHALMESGMMSRALKEGLVLGHFALIFFGSHLRLYGVSE
jgi:hypothetical protein